MFRKERPADAVTTSVDPFSPIIARFQQRIQIQGCERPSMLCAQCSLHNTTLTMPARGNWQVLPSNASEDPRGSNVDIGHALWDVKCRRHRIEPRRGRAPRLVTSRNSLD